LTIAALAKKINADPKYLVNFESGERDYMRPSPHQMAELIEAYGVTENALSRLIHDELEWRTCAHDGRLETLPRIAHYHRGELPAIARSFFEQREFVVLDLETTGSDPHSERTEVLEIAIVDANGKPVLNTLVKAFGPIPAEAQAIHGISNEMVASAPTFREIYPQLVQAISGKVIVIFNANYDAYLLDNLIIRHGLDLPHFDQWCLMKAYANYYKSPGKYKSYAWQKLSDACKQQDVKLTEAHRAMGDTLATYLLLKKLAEK
jgi:DNA polymerase III epsilon subunit-like protein